MYDLIGKKWWFFIFSGLIIIPGIISLLFWGLRLSIDFTGGSLIELKFKNRETPRQKIEEIIKNQNIETVSLTQTREKTYLLRLKPINKDQNEKLQQELGKSLGAVDELRFETVGHVIGQESTKNAVKAIIIDSIAIIIYIAMSFRHIPKPYSSW